MTDSFGGWPGPDIVPNPDAELRATDAAGPDNHRHMADIEGFGVSARVVAVILIVGAVIVWLLTSVRP